MDMNMREWTNIHFTGTLKDQLTQKWDAYKRLQHVQKDSFLTESSSKLCELKR